MALRQKEYGPIQPHYHDAVARGYEFGSTFIYKFGRNSAVSTDIEDVWDNGSTYAGWLSTGSSITITAEAAADVAAGTGIQSVRVSGLDSDYNILVEDVAMNADTTAGSSTLAAFYRVNRVYGLSAGTGQTNAGDIILTASTGGEEMARIVAGSGQTLMAVWTVPAGFDMIMENLEITALATDNVSARLEYLISTDNVWRCQWTGQVEAQVSLDPLPIIVPEKSDVRIRATAEVTGGALGTVSASWLGIMIPSGQ